MKRSSSSAVFFVSALLFLSVCASAQTGNTALPPKAKQAFENGIAAAQRQDWNSAIRYLTEAQQAAPFSGPILFNLGLAHARAGHEVAAIAWLHAYLSASSAPSDAARVRSEIDTLSKVAGFKIKKLLDGAVTASVKNYGTNGQMDADLLLLCRSLAGSGDRDGCLLAAARSKAVPEPIRLCGRAYARYLAEGGDRESALATLRRLPGNNDEEIKEIAWGYLQWDDYESARFFAEQGEEPVFRRLWLEWIASAADPGQVITIPRKGEYYIGKERIEGTEVPSRIVDFAQKRADSLQTVIVRTDGWSSYATELENILHQRHIINILVIPDRWATIMGEDIANPGSQNPRSQHWMKLARYLSSMDDVINLRFEFALLRIYPFLITSHFSLLARSFAERLNEVRALEKRLNRKERPH